MLISYDDIKDIVIDENVSGIEIRFDYKYGLSQHKYKQMLHYLDKHIVSNQELVSTNYDRYTKNTVVTKNNVSEFYEKKHVGHIYNENYDVDIVVVDVNKMSNATRQITNKVRNKIKYRYQIIIGEATIIIELSEIIEDYDQQKYEMELKYKHEDILRISKHDVKVLNQTIYDLLLRLNETNILYTIKTKNSMLDSYNKLQLKKNECQFITNDVIGMQCAQSIKAVGKKRMLVFHTTGLWLINECVYNLIIDATLLHNVLFSYNTSVFEGVVAKTKDHDDYEFNYYQWFICYDCVALHDKNIQCERFDTRFNAMLELNKRIGFYIDETYFKYSLQSIKYSDTPDKFHDNVRYLLNLAKDVNYFSDGIIFTPIHGCLRYKWMEAKQISTNFTLYNGNLYYSSDTGNNSNDNGNSNGNSNCNSNSSDVKFTGTDKYPMKLLEEAFIEHYDGDKKIVECVYDNTLKRMVVKRVRNDVIKADNIDVILDNWYYINHPISEDDIKGNTMYFANYYLKWMFKEFVESYQGEKKIVKDLSPYWKDENTLDTFVNDISGYEKIFFMSIDGEALMHLYDNDDVVEIVFDDITTIKNNGDNFDIIVGGKRKKYNYVFLNDLTYKLKGYKLMMYEHVMNEQLLTTEANIYTSLYVYGYYQRVNY